MSGAIYVRVKLVNHTKITVISYKVQFFLAYRFLDDAYRVSLLSHKVM